MISSYAGLRCIASPLLISAPNHPSNTSPCLIATERAPLRSCRCNVKNWNKRKAIEEHGLHESHQNFSPLLRRDAAKSCVDAKHGNRNYFKNCQTNCCKSQDLLTCKSEVETHTLQDSSWKLLKTKGPEVLKAIVVQCAAAALLVLIPVECIDYSPHLFGAGAAQAAAIPGAFDKFRKVEEATEELVATAKSGKVMDKFVQLLSSQAVLPEEFNVEKVKQGLKAVLDDDHTNDFAAEELWNDFRKAVKEQWTWIFDLVVDVAKNPLAETEIGVESLFAGVVAFFEGIIEKLTAMEVSLAVGLGERWVLFTPLMAIPMWWQMTRNRSPPSPSISASSSSSSSSSSSAVSASLARSQHVRNALQRMAATSELEDALSQWRRQFPLLLPAPPTSSSSSSSSSLRTEITSLLTRLVELNPEPSPADVSAGHLLPSPSLRGQWRLLHVCPTEGQQQRLNASLPPGLEVTKVSQKLMLPMGSSPGGPGGEEAVLAAEYSVDVRLGQLGECHVSMRGTWQREGGSNSGSMTVESVQVQPRKVLAAVLGEALPAPNVTLPAALQQTVEWELLYLNDTLRIEKDGAGNLFLLERVVP